jgi:hypothetical protein
MLYNPTCNRKVIGECMTPLSHVVCRFIQIVKGDVNEGMKGVGMATLHCHVACWGVDGLAWQLLYGTVRDSQLLRGHSRRIGTEAVRFADYLIICSTYCSTVFCIEDGGSLFFRNVGELTLNGVTSQKATLFVVIALGSSGLTNIRIVVGRTGF